MPRPSATTCACRPGYAQAVTSAPGTTDLRVQLLALSAEQLAVSPAELTRDALLAEDLGVDSLAAIEWAMAVEDAFGIGLPEDVWSRVTTYGQAEDLVLRTVGS